MTTVDRPAQDATRLSLLGRTIPGTLELTVHLVACGDTMECCDESWRDALAVVEHGSIQLDTGQGACLWLTEGDAFCLALIGPALIRNTGAETAVIAAIRGTAAPHRYLSGHASQPLTHPNRKGPRSWT